MGLFSFKCTACHKPLLGPFHINSINAWMNSVVALKKKQVTSGAYDGYGRIETGDDDAYQIALNEDYDAAEEVYHNACWLTHGRPIKQTKKRSLSAPDQGHFFDVGTYDIPSPLSKRKE